MSGSPADTSPAGPDIVCSGVSKTFAGRSGRAVHALDSIDLVMPAGQVTAVVGPSGCGKSTLLRIIAGLETADHPRSVDLGGSTAAELQRTGQIAVAFQDASLLPWLTARGNVTLAQKLAHRRIDKAAADDLLRLVGLGGFETAKPAQLSGGMRQRVAIARCLASEPSILLLDEPFGAVDELTRRRLNLELPRTWADRRATTMLVTHSISEAVLLADQVVVMTARPGRIAGIVPIDLPRPRAAKHLTDPVFTRAADEISALLGIDDELSIGG